jgi:hypothetical protein
MGELIVLAKYAFSQVPAAAWEDRSLFARRDYFLTVWHRAPLVAVPRLVVESAVRIVLLDEHGERWRELTPPFPVRYAGDRVAVLTIE